MPISSEDEPGRQDLAGGKGSREPKATAPTNAVTALGTQALHDGAIMVAGAWLLLFLLAFSLRHHNI
jgi:hypothetical protein